MVGGRGVEVSGLNVNLTGTLGASIGDTAGAKYSACAGMSGLDGSLIKNATLTDAGAKARVGGLAATLGTSLVTDNALSRWQNPGTSEARLSSIGGVIGNVVDAVFHANYKTAGFGGIQSGSVDGVLFIVSVLKAVGDSIDTVAMIVRIFCTMEKTGGSWETWERPFGASKISRSDIFTILSMVAKLAAWIAAWGWITNKVVRASFNTKVTIKPTEIVIDAPKVDNFAVKTRTGIARKRT